MKPINQLIQKLRAKGFDIQLGPGLPGGVDRFVAYVFRGGMSRGYFGRTEIEALRKALAKVDKDFS